MAGKFYIVVALLCIVPIVYACNEAICASVVSKCMLTQSCKCDLKDCSCCKDCFNCLSYLYSECCSCVGKYSPFLNIIVYDHHTQKSCFKNYTCLVIVIHLSCRKVPFTTTQQYLSHICSLPNDSQAVCNNHVNRLNRTFHFIHKYIVYILELIT